MIISFLTFGQTRSESLNLPLFYRHFNISILLVTFSASFNALVGLSNDIYYCPSIGGH